MIIPIFLQRIRTTTLLKASDNLLVASNEKCSNEYFIYGENGWKK
tara:strand:- start:611 stop:745 length:135 start_codon:yes stop_codon:yes gene_type:complete